MRTLPAIGASAATLHDRHPATHRQLGFYPPPPPLSCPPTLSAAFSMMACAVYTIWPTACARSVSLLTLSATMLP